MINPNNAGLTFIQAQNGDRGRADAQPVILEQGHVEIMSHSQADDIAVGDAGHKFVFGQMGGNLLQCGDGKLLGLNKCAAIGEVHGSRIGQ